MDSRELGRHSGETRFSPGVAPRPCARTRLTEFAEEQPQHQRQPTRGQLDRHSRQKWEIRDKGEKFHCYCSDQPIPTPSSTQVPKHGNGHANTVDNCKDDHSEHRNRKHLDHSLLFHDLLTFPGLTHHGLNGSNELFIRLEPLRG